VNHILNAQGTTAALANKLAPLTPLPSTTSILMPLSSTNEPLPPLLATPLPVGRGIPPFNKGVHVPSTSNMVTLDNTSAVYKFFPIEPNFPKWQNDLASPEGSYVMLAKADPKSTVDPYKDNATPTMFFAASVLKEIMYIAKKMASTRQEVGGFILIKQLQDMYPHFVAYDHFMVGQEVTGVRVEMDNDDMVKHMDRLRETYPKELGEHINCKMMHWHLHPQMGVTFSSTDTAQQMGKDKLGFRDDYKFFLCVNEKGDMNLQMLQYYPVFYRFDKVNIGMYYGENYLAELNKKRKKVLDMWIDKLVTPTKSAFIGDYGGYGNHTVGSQGYIANRNTQINKFIGNSTTGFPPVDVNGRDIGNDPNASFDFNTDWNGFSEEERFYNGMDSAGPLIKDDIMDFDVPEINALEGGEINTDSFGQVLHAYITNMASTYGFLEDQNNIWTVPTEILQEYTQAFVDLAYKDITLMIRVLRVIAVGLRLKNLSNKETVSPIEVTRDLRDFVNSYRDLSNDMISAYAMGVATDKVSATNSDQDEILGLLMQAYSTYVIKQIPFTDEMDKITKYEEFMKEMFQM